MDLLREQWIDVLSVDGPVTLSLAEVAANLGDIIDVVSDDPLVDAAILRLLLAADTVSGGDIAGWLSSTARRWHLFDPREPFWQNAMMAEHLDQPGTVGPAVTLLYRYTGNGNVLLDHHHNESATPVTAVEAARALVMRQQFSTMGIQPWPQGIWGTKSAKPAVAALRPLTWIDAGNLADTLAANRCPGPAGEFLFTWPDGLTPGASPDPGGQADALSWQARSMLLVPGTDGLISGLAVTEGLRYSPGADPQRVPHTLFTPITQTEPAPEGAPVAWRAAEPSMSRPAWRQLLAGWADPDTPGVVARARTAPEGARLRMTGLATRQSSIDGVQTGQLPGLALTAQDAQELDAGIAAAWRAVRRGANAGAASAAPSARSWSSGLMPTAERLYACFEPIVAAAAAGEVGVADAVEQMRVEAVALIGDTAAMLAGSRPVAAAMTMKGVR